MSRSRSLFLPALAVLAACDALSAPPPAELPWLRGFTPAAIASLPSPRATQRMSQLVEASVDEDFGALEVRADLGGDARPERVLASYVLGVAVLDDRDRVIARGRGFEPGGSADDLLAISVGDGQLAAPVLVIATQAGGHRTSVTTLAVYRLAGRALQPLFAQPIEIRDGDQTHEGAATFVPGGLWYRAPDASAAALWRFDAAQARYVEPAARDAAPTS